MIERLLNISKLRKWYNHTDGQASVRPIISKDDKAATVTAEARFSLDQQISMFPVLVFVAKQLFKRIRAVVVFDGFWNCDA